ncbi:hypothetical protein FIBSPDRAFT_740041, partial [Athelia psychrophila]
CSACHRTKYCSLDCCKADWPKHKEECMSEKRINAMLGKINAAEAAKPKPRPAKDRCTGCGVKFPQGKEEQDEDALDDSCDDCGYMSCGSCVCHDIRSSCYCYISNFGRPYCIKSPAWYHGGRGKHYTGDRHPADGREEHREAFEAEPRECGNCGKVTRCMKKEYLR